MTVIDDSRTGAAIPHPSTEVDGADAVSAAAPLATNFARHVEAPPSLGAWTGGCFLSGAVGVGGAVSSGGRGGGKGGSPAIVFIDVAKPSTRPISINVARLTLGIEGPLNLTSPSREASVCQRVSFAFAAAMLSRPNYSKQIR